MLGATSAVTIILFSLSCFNPRPAWMLGATFSQRSIDKLKGVFQSSPSLDAGRYNNVLRRSYYRTKFQSSPSLDAGRYIPCSPLLSYNSSFNPRPAWMLGATRHAINCGCKCRVSILAQLGCWALQYSYNLMIQQKKSL